MSKKGWITSICFFACAVLFSVLTIFNFQEIERLVGEYFYLCMTIGTSVILLLLAILARKRTIFLLIPILILFATSYYFDYFVGLNITDYSANKATLFTSYPVIEFILFIVYITALVFALLKKQKWAIIVVIVCVSINIFKYIINPLLLMDLDDVADYLFVSLSILMSYIGMIVYFSSMLSNKNTASENSEEKEIE